MAEPKKQEDLPEEPKAGISAEDLFRAAAGVDSPESREVSDGNDSLNVYQRMAIAQEAFPYLYKPVVDGVRWRPVLHDDVARLARAALLKAGLYAQPTVVDHGWGPDRLSTNRKGDPVVTVNAWVVVQMDYINRDVPADRFSVTMIGEGGDPADKGMGKAISYACKFCHLKAFGVETGEDAESELQSFDAQPPSGPSKEEQEQIERGEFYEWITNSIRTHELDGEYVKAEMKQHSKGASPTTKELAGFAKSIDEDPGMWRKPTRDEEE